MTRKDCRIGRALYLLVLCLALHSSSAADASVARMDQGGATSAGAGVTSFRSTRRGKKDKWKVKRDYTKGGFVGYYDWWNPSASTSSAGTTASTGGPLCASVDGGQCAVTTLAGTLGSFHGSSVRSVGDVITKLNSPWGIAVSPVLGDTKALISEDMSHILIGMDYTTGVMTVLAGKDGNDGSKDGDADKAEFDGPRGVAFSSDGTRAYICDSNNDEIRIFDYGSNEVDTMKLKGDDKLYFPFGIAASADGKYLVVVDHYDNKKSGHSVKLIHLFDLHKGKEYNAVELVGGSRGNSNGMYWQASLDLPSSVAITPDSKYAIIADSSNNQIRNVSLDDGYTTRLAGTGSSEWRDGVATYAKFNRPCGVSLMPDGSGAVIADTSNSRIRYIHFENMTVWTVAGTGTSGAASGTGSTAKFYTPFSVAVTPDAQNILVVDSYNQAIRKISVTVPEAEDWYEDITFEEFSDMDLDIDLDISPEEFEALKAEYMASLQSYSEEGASSEVSTDSSQEISVPSFGGRGSRGSNGKYGKCKIKMKHRYKKRKKYRRKGKGKKKPDDYGEDPEKQVARQEVRFTIAGFIAWLKARLSTSGSFSGYCQGQNLPPTSDPVVLTYCLPGTEPFGDSCRDCEPGFYQPITDNSTCFACPSNSNTSTSGASNRSECMCMPGYYSDGEFEAHDSPYVGRMKCKECPYGSYCTGGKQLRSCPENAISVRFNKKVSGCFCAPGYYSIRELDGDEIVCKDCDEGYYCEGDKKRVRCPVYYFSKKKAKWKYGCYFSNKIKRVYQEEEVFVNIDVNVTDYSAIEDDLLNCVIGYANVSKDVDVEEEVEYDAKVSWNLKKRWSNGAGKWKGKYGCKIKDWLDYEEDRDGDFFLGDYKRKDAWKFLRYRARKWRKWLRKIFRPRIEILATTTTTTTTTTTLHAYCQNVPTDPDGDVEEYCASGLTSNNITDCYDCDYGTYKYATDNSSCISCPSGTNTSLTGTANASDCFCYRGTYSVDYNSDDGSTTYPCLACPQDFFCTGGTDIKECPPNSYSLANSGNITDCKCIPGYFSIGELSDENLCSLCEAGKYCTGGQMTQTCPSGATSVEGSSMISNCSCTPGFYDLSGSCTACPPGTYKTSMGLQACTPCPAGTWSAKVGATADDVCVQCPANSISVPPAASLTSCVCMWGYEGAAGGVCTACPAGRYKDTNDSFACGLCVEGKYSSEVGATSESMCTACPANSVTLGQGSTSISDCVCDVGYSVASSSDCGTSSMTCAACAAGSYKDSKGCASCAQCPAGTYANSALTAQTSSSVCESCPFNSYTESAGATSINSCICKAGYTGSPQSSVACTPCPKGTYKPLGGDAACTPCGVNTYSEVDSATSSATCASCPDFSSSASQSQGISDCTCSDGYSGPSAGPCVECQSGTYCSGGTLTFCEDNMDSPPRSSLASSCTCNAGYVPQTGGGCVACSKGSYASVAGQASCQPCLANQYSDKLASTSCTDCPSNTVSGAGSQSAAACVCIDGYFGLPCQPCTNGTWCTGGVRTFCQSGSTSDAMSSSSSDCTCNAGYEPSGASCVACAGGTYKAAPGSASCGNCPANTYTISTASTSCQSCPASSYSPEGSSGIDSCGCTTGYYQSGSSCLPCPAGGYCSGGTALKLACPANAGSPEMSGARSACVCNAGYTGDAGTGDCSVCPAGSYKSVNGSSSCVDCGAGTYSFEVGATLSSTCVSCPSGSYSSAGSGSSDLCLCNVGFTGSDGGPCGECLAGTYKSASGPAECTQCPAGSWSSATGSTSDTCTACGSNSQSPTGSSIISSCACNAGYTGADGSCTPCGEGHYKDSVGSSNCKKCPVNTYLATTGATSLSDCQACPTDSKSPAGTTSVAGCKCKKGFKNSGGSCVACTPGTYNKVSTGVTFCTACSAGTYGTTNTEDCADCPANTYSAAEQSSITDCYCNAGYTGSGGTSCTACAAGTYKQASGSAVCDSCPADTYSGTVASVDPSDCIACPSNSGTDGQTQKTLKTECKCNAGYTGADGTSCAACAMGSYKASMGSASCDLCPAGKYLASTGATSLSDCVACPANSNSPEGSTDITQCTCNAGYTGSNGGTCTACVAGTYKPSSGSQSCTQCGAATWSTAVGAVDASTCSPCKSNSNSAAGASAESQCTCNVGYTGSDGGTCTACSAGSYKGTTGSAACSSCAAGTYSASTGASVCTTCPSNSNSAGGSTSEAACICVDGYSLSGGSTCVPCEAGTYCTGGVKDTCPLNSISDAQSPSISSCKCMRGFTGPDGSACVECAVGKFKATVGSEACQSCPANTYSGLTGSFTQAEAVIAFSRCTACPALTGSTTPGSLADCTCVNGYFGDASSGCVECPTGSYCTGGTKTSCIFGSDSAAMSYTPSNCSCLPGFGSTSSGTCDMCQGGTYKAGYGDGACLDCELGKYSTAQSEVNLAMVHLSVCLSCPSNAISPARSNGIASCKCKPGYSGTNDGACRACGVGTFKGTTGPVSCQLCSEGSYTETDASQSCSSCPANSNSPEGSHLNESCTCNKGYTLVDGECVSCPAGTYKASTGPGACTLCPAGTYSSMLHATQEADCTPCQDDSNSPEGSTVASNCTCNEGRAGANCELCAAGTYCSGGLVFNCTLYSSSPVGSMTGAACTCNPGYTLTGYLGNCTACSLNTYKDHSGNDTCSECPIPLVTARNASDSLGRCVCPPGYFGPIGGPCELCRAGQWCSLGAASSCSAFSSSPPGSKSPLDCVAVPGYYAEPGQDAKICPLDHWCPGGTYAYQCESGTESGQGTKLQAQCVCKDGYSGEPGGPCAQCVIDDAACDVEEPDPEQCICPTGDKSPCIENAFLPFGGTDTANCRCRNGYYGTNDAGCNYCPENNYCPGGAFTIPCPANAVSPEGALIYTQCVCKSGYYGEAGGMCTICPENSWCFAGELNDCPQNSLSPSGSSSQSDCKPMEGYGSDGSLPYQACAPGTYCQDGVMKDCPIYHTSPWMATTIDQCDPLPGYPRWVNESLTRLSTNCRTDPCEIGYYRGECNRTDMGTCLPCTIPSLAGAAYTTPGDPYDQNNCDWKCNLGYGRSSQAGICIKGAPAAIQLVIEYPSDLTTYTSEKASIIAAIAESLGLEPADVTVVEVTEGEGGVLRLTIQVAVLGGSEETMCSKLSTNNTLSRAMASRNLPPGTLVSCGAVLTTPPVETTPIPEPGTTASETLIIIGAVAGAAGVSMGVAAGTTIHYRRIRMRKIAPNSIDPNADPLTAQDDGPRFEKKAFGEEGVDAQGKFAQRTGKAPVFQNPFLAGEGPANAGDMTMQTMGEWDWGELATE